MLLREYEDDILSLGFENILNYINDLPRKMFAPESLKYRIDDEVETGSHGSPGSPFKKNKENLVEEEDEKEEFKAAGAFLLSDANDNAEGKMPEGKSGIGIEPSKGEEEEKENKVNSEKTDGIQEEGEIKRGRVGCANTIDSVAKKEEASEFEIKDITGMLRRVDVSTALLEKIKDEYEQNEKTASLNSY